jgi:hypothetical protein
MGMGMQHRHGQATLKWTYSMDMRGEGCCSKWWFGERLALVPLYGVDVSREEHEILDLTLILTGHSQSKGFRV